MPKRDKLKDWTYLDFKFKDQKSAYKFARWMQVGQELGLVPDSLELLLQPKRVALGHTGLPK